MLHTPLTDALHTWERLEILQLASELTVPARRVENVLHTETCVRRSRLEAAGIVGMDEHLRAHPEEVVAGEGVWEAWREGRIHECIEVKHCTLGEDAHLAAQLRNLGEHARRAEELSALIERTCRAESEASDWDRAYNLRALDELVRDMHSSRWAPQASPDSEARREEARAAEVQLAAEIEGRAALAWEQSVAAGVLAWARRVMAYALTGSAEAALEEDLVLMGTSNIQLEAKARGSGVYSSYQTLTRRAIASEQRGTGWIEVHLVPRYVSQWLRSAATFNTGQIQTAPCADLEAARLAAKMWDPSGREGEVSLVQAVENARNCISQ